MNITLAYDMGEAFVADLHQTFPEVNFRIAYTAAEQLRAASDTEIQFGTIDRPTFLAADKLRWFHFVGIGFDPYLRSIPELVDSPVVMTNARGTHVICMADHVFAMALAFSHRLPQLFDDQRDHRWDTDKYIGTMGELAGSTMGVLAMGDIGRAVAQRAQGFDMEVYAVDIKPMDPPPGVREVWGLERLDDLLEISDWLVVTAPLTEQTRGLIDRQRLERLKSGGHIIVVSRGHIVEENALIEGLRSGQVAGAALDATDQEPLAADNPLWDLPNVILSPHVSAESAQMLERRRQIFKDNLRRYLAGQPLLHVCDKLLGY